MSLARSEMAGLIVVCFACLGLFHGLGLHVRTLEIVFVVFGIIAAITFLLLNLREPRRPVLALIAIPLLALLGYGLMRAIFWYFVTYLPSRGEPLFKFGP